MKRIFRWTLYGYAIYFVLTFIAMFISVAASEGTGLYDVGIALLAAIMITSPFLVLTSLVTGIASYMRRNQGEKQKLDFMPYEDSDYSRLERIMNQLSPQDRAFLERKLADKEVGLSDDGEIVSMNDLLDKNEEKSKRDW